MLTLKDIKKMYRTGDEESVALNNVNLTFGDNEFVSILGASGSGKTTLLNIIGGLDKYTSGDLLVDGTSTKDFSDKDWDSYRNGTIGFVFQSYNLISHLSILDNVKMALSLSGISSKEGEERSKEALIEVGLGDHINKKPSQLSGGQMQRVAIARALVNNPKIILADEPTGALDTKTSIQIMELIKDISKNRLVIMVTHNPELAQQYSDRIIRVSDGEVIEDTNPFDGNEGISSGFQKNKTSMSFLSAVKSSAKNLWTKKTRTILVTVAGSIGIISIGLVLSLSAGMTSYIDTMQKDSLSGTPITINAQEGGMSLSMPTTPNSNEISSSENTILKPAESDESHKNYYSEDVLNKGYTFIEYFEKNASDYYSSISYENGYNLKALTKNNNNEVQEVKINSLSASSGLNMPEMDPSTMFGSSNLFSQLPEDEEPVLNQYDIVTSKDDNFTYPSKADEIVLVVGSDNTLEPDVLKALGYADDEEIDFKDIIGKEVSIISNDNYYEQSNGANYYQLKSVNDDMYKTGVTARVVAVLRPKESTNSLISGTIGYTKVLSDNLLKIETTSHIVTAQKENSKSNILSPSNETIDDDTYTTLLQSLGGDQTPTKIDIYPTTFEERNQVIDVIKDYNDQVAEKYGVNTDDYKKYEIQYTDLAQTMTETMSTMIDTITYILTAFAAISLVVSSIMIGILTYVSVVERTKEIGIMRAIGARKKDITRIFNAESSIIGIISGAFGVGIAYLCCVPINNMVESALGVEGFVASLSATNAIGLTVLSVALTFIAGLIPAKGAAKKDPVEALRTE